MRNRFRWHNTQLHNVANRTKGEEMTTPIHDLLKADWSETIKTVESREQLRWRKRHADVLTLLKGIKSKSPAIKIAISEMESWVK